MWIILGVLLSLSAFALEPFEKVRNVKILRVLADNIVMVNRGMEDGILRNDHAKFSLEGEGFASRAICVRASAETSYWKLYRIPYAEAISKDYTYNIVGMADKEIPDPLNSVRDSAQKFTDPDEKKKTEDIGPNPFEIKRDLPERLTERDLIEAVGPEKRKLFIEQAIDQDRLKQDLSDYRFSVFASPFVKQSINDAESLRYGFRGGNIASKYRLLTQFEQYQSRMKDPETKDSVSTRNTRGQVQFVIHHLTPSVSSLSLVNYRSDRFSAEATPRSQIQVGPIGFTLHMYESKTWEYMDLSYIPLYDTRTTDIRNIDGSTRTDKTNGIRHGVRFAVRTKINERVSFENILWAKPFQDLATWGFEGDNLNLENDLKLIFNISGNLFFDYNFVYQKDKLWKTLNNLPENNVINSLNLRYDFNI